jgi:microcystin-dependent protein
MINRNIVNTTLSINKLPYVYSFQSAIPAGTVTLFQQTTAPVGWTKLTVHDNKALRLITGTAGSGGSVAFTTVFTNQAPTITTNTLAGAATTLTGAQLPVHTHLVQTAAGQTWATTSSIVPTPGYPNTKGAPVPGATTTTSAATGGGTAHTHTITAPTSPTVVLAVQYVDLILAQKN